jgi:hypothetical protein
MVRSHKVIVTWAATGAIHVPFETPYLTVTRDQILDSALVDLGWVATSNRSSKRNLGRCDVPGQPTADR